MAYSHYHCCHGNTTMWIVKLHITLNNIIPKALLQECYNMFPLYCCTCCHQQYKSAQCCHGQHPNMDFLCTAIKLLNIFLLVSTTQKYLGYHIQCQIFLSQFNQTWTFLIDFRASLQNEFWCKSVQWELIWYMQTDRHAEDNGHSFGLCLHA